MTSTPTTHRGIDALIAERIIRTLNASQRNVAWLSRQTGISSRVLHSRLMGRTTWNLSELGAVAHALGCGWGELVEIHEAGEQR